MHAKGFVVIVCIFAFLPKQAASLYRPNAKNTYQARLEGFESEARRAFREVLTLIEKINEAEEINRFAWHLQAKTIFCSFGANWCRLIYRVVVTTADASPQGASVMHSKARHLLQSTTSPEDACALFGQGYGSLYWDSEKSRPREFPDGECGQEGMGILYGQGLVSQDMLKKVCSLTGPATNTSCGENGYLGYLNKFASPLMGLITDQCR
jgi:hypothetical protein